VDSTQQRVALCVQCELPDLPEDVFISLTYTPTYVDRMRSAVVTYVTKYDAQAPYTSISCVYSTQTGLALEAQSHASEIKVF
jgi:hypothetical protein